jgi:hypothetical protein
VTLEEAATTVEWAALVAEWHRRGRPPLEFADFLREAVDDATADALTEAAALEFAGVSSDGDGGLRPFMANLADWSWESSLSGGVVRSDVGVDVFARLRSWSPWGRPKSYPTAADAILDYLRAAAEVCRETAATV